MEVTVLGPMAVVDGGEPLAIGGPKPRAVLAMLIANPGQVVAADVLVQAVYGDDAPGSRRRTISTYISALRAEMGDAIVREGEGWRLTLDRSSIDALRFEDLIVSAGRLRSDQASQVLSEALALWRGRPYDGVEANGHLDAEVSRLEELRLHCLERRIDADLASGRDADLVPELVALIAEHPYREGIRARHMTALYRSGRQQEALKSFEQLRQILLDDLGVDPTLELRDLEQRILRHDETLRAAPEPEGQPLRGYRLLEEIGSGAFSIVWRGLQPSVGREVAIKQIRSELTSRPEFIRAFEAEAQLIAKVEHPHVVPLIDYWRDPDSAYLVMRWLRGGTVERSLDDGPWSVEQTLRMARQVGEGLAEAHARGVIHRDVKTANILLDEQGNAFLGDFGIALDAVESAGPRAALSHGSPGYAAPEQLRKEQLGPQADIFSLGVVIFECLVGDLPFPDTVTAAEMVRRQLTEPYPSITALRPDVPKHLADAVTRATAKEPDDRFASVLDFVGALESESDQAVPGRSGAARATLVSGDLDNPYKGLRRFDEGDAGDFFGRDRLVDELLQQLDGDGVGSRCLTVVGPSGSGKSSVVRAGLLPALRAGRVDGSDRWFVTTMVPGAHPYEAMEAALLRVAVNPPTTLLHQLSDGPRGILRTVRRCLASEDDRILLVVDQLEELFTSTPDDRAESFLRALAVAVEDPATPIRVVTTLRADYYDRPLAHAHFAPVLKAGSIDVTPLAPDELESAITGPVERQGLEFEPGLVARIAAEALGQPGPLPLLQYAMAELFEHRADLVLTSEAYGLIGGLAGSLATRAEELYLDGTATEQAATRHIFGRLINPEQATADLRRRVSAVDLGDDEATRAVLERFSAARLLTFDRDARTREPTVEVAHEALLREWPRLADWLEEDRVLLRSIEHLSTSATAWHEGGREVADLYRGGRLETASELIVGTPDRLRPLDREYVDASNAESETEREHERTRVRRLRRLVAGVGAALVIALAAGAFAFQQQQRADDEAADAVAQAERADANAAQADENAAEARANAAEADANASEAERNAARADAAAADAQANAARADASAAEALESAAEAERQRNLAEGRALLEAVPNVLSADPQLALLLSTAAADRLGDHPDAFEALHNSLAVQRTLYTTRWNGDFGDGFQVDGDLSADGRLLAVVGPTGGTVEVHDVDRGELVWTHTFDVDRPIEHEVTANFIGDGDELMLGLSWHPPAERAFDPPSELIGFHVVDARTGEFLRRYPSGPCGPVGVRWTNWAVLGESSPSATLAVSLSQEWFDEFGCVPSPHSGPYPAVDVSRIDLASGESTPIVSNWAGGTIAVSMSADARRAALGWNGSPPRTVTVIDIDSGTVVNVLDKSGHTGGGPGVALNTDGSRAQVQGATNGEGVLFDVESGEILEVYPDPELGVGLSGGGSSSDGSRQYLSDRLGRLTLFDTDRRLVGVVPTIGGEISVVRGTPDFARVATFGANNNRTVTVLDLERVPEVDAFDPCGEAGLERKFYLNRSLVVHDDLLTVMAQCEEMGTEDADLLNDSLSGSFGPARAYTYARSTGELVATHRAHGQMIAVTDGDEAFMQTWTGEDRDTWFGGEIELVDIRTGERRETLDGVCPSELLAINVSDEPLACDGGVALAAGRIAASRDGSVVAITGPQSFGPVLAWNRATGSTMELDAAAVGAIGVAQDGSKLAIVEQFDAAAGAFGAIRLHRTDDFGLIAESDGSPEPVFGMADFSPDGSVFAVVVGDPPSALRIHDGASGELIARRGDLHEGVTMGFAFDSQGERIATVGTDGFARIWDADSFTLLHEIDVGGFASSVAFADGDRNLAVMIRDGGIRIYHLESADLLDLAAERLVRGFTTAECSRYFPDDGCPTLEDLLAR